MTAREDLLRDLTPIFRDVLERPDLVLTPTTSAKDVPSWDSFAHINLVVAIEDGYGISFTTRELGEMTCVGDLVALLDQRGIRARGQ